MTPSRMLLYWGPPVLLMALIWGLSTDAGSSGNTSGLLEALLGTLAPGLLESLTAAQLYALNHVVRKAAHVTAYLVLGLLCIRAARFGRRGLSPRALALGAAVAALYAVLDEVHQSWHPSRSASAGDVLYDWLGASLAAGWCWARSRRTAGRAGSGRVL